jgi:CBS domain containing-hemolysin-like protein
LDTDEQHKKKQEKKESSGLPWALRVFFIAVALSAVLSGVSSEALGNAGLPLAFAVLIFFILLGILFDVIGVAVTAADERPFHSMAAHRTPGAREALGLIRKAPRVSSFCNDVVGDICGIVSGATAAVIALRLQEVLSAPGLLLSLTITALASGVTVGGKALGKRFAIERSTQVLTLVGRFLHLFSGNKR